MPAPAASRQAARAGCSVPSCLPREARRDPGQLASLPDGRPLVRPPWRRAPGALARAARCSGSGGGHDVDIPRAAGYAVESKGETADEQELDLLLEQLG